MFIKATFMLVSLAFLDGEPMPGTLVEYDYFLTEKQCEHMAEHVVEAFNGSPQLQKLYHEDLGADRVQVGCIKQDHTEDYKEL
jgi:hypothetical protein